MLFRCSEGSQQKKQQYLGKLEAGKVEYKRKEVVEPLHRVRRAAAKQQGLRRLNRSVYKKLQNDLFSGKFQENIGKIFLFLQEMAAHSLVFCLLLLFSSLAKSSSINRLKGCKPFRFHVDAREYKTASEVHVAPRIY